MCVSQTARTLATGAVVAVAAGEGSGDGVAVGAASVGTGVCVGVEVGRMGAVATGRPVLVAYSRRESHLTTTKRHPMRFRIRSGWSAAGRLAAVEAEILAATGAYASWAPNVLRKAAIHSGAASWVGASIRPSGR